MTYWVLIASYTALGINLFAARLPFLLAGVATIWVTYQFSVKLFQQRRIAMLSAAILASNTQFIVLSVRATPDMLQVLFMILSLYGFFALVIESDYRLRYYLLTYIGAAFAIQTKGLLGVVLIGFMALYLIITRKGLSIFKPVYHWPLMAIALVIALSWYLYVYFQLGGEHLWRFYRDQVDGKITVSKLNIVLNIAEYIWGVFRNLFPWSFIVLAGYLAQPKEIRRFVVQHRQQVVFILGWFVLLLAIFSGGTDNRTRYLLPAYPLFCVLLAALFWNVFDQPRIQKIWKWCCGIILIFLGVLGLSFSWVGLIIHWQLLLGGALLFGAVAWTIFKAIRIKQSPAPVAIGLLLIVATADVRGMVLPQFDFAPSKTLIGCILPEMEAGRVASVWSGKRANYLRQMYTLSKGRVKVNYYSQGQVPKNLDPRAVVVLTRQEKDNLNTQNYAIEQCGSVFKEPDISIVWQALISMDKEIVMEAIQEPLYLARPMT